VQQVVADRAIGKPVRMRELSALSDIEFEELVADLFAAEFGTPVERFARGADGGIDLRWDAGEGKTAVGQCKHYPRSTFAQLKAAAKAERAHLVVVRPDTYRFVTSYDLNPGQKAALVAELKPWLARPEHVYGGRDIDGLISRQSGVEQRHPKLWLTTGTQLFWATHSDLASRASALRARIDLVIPRYVTNASFALASGLLEKHRTCVIAGLPGIGKTTLAYALVADAITRDYEPIEVSEDINEAWSAYRPDVQQVFLYDDFLGQLTFSERLGKNEDARLADFIAQISGTKSKLLVMTTREYILQDAQRQYPNLKAIDSKRHFVVELKDYSREDRARILYNHLWHADLPPTALREIASGGCIPIVDHPNYSPRLIEYCTGPAFDTTGTDYPGRFLEHLAHPEQLWRTAFEDHLTNVQQLLAASLATLPPRAALDDLQTAHEALCTRRGISVTAAEFRSSLQMMEGTFVAVDMNRGMSIVRFHNPSVRSFVLDWLGQDRSLVADTIDAATFFEQITRLHQYATGHRSGALTGEPASVELELSVAQASDRVTAGFLRLITSPSPERSSRWIGHVEAPVMSWYEDRLEVLLQMPDDVRPATDWLSEQLAAITARWRRAEGHKARAVRLLATVEQASATRLSKDVSNAAGAALDEWLEQDLYDVDDDWEPYLDRLQRVHHIDLSRAEDVAVRFEEFVQEQLTQYSPAPPSLGELMEFAERFGLDDLWGELEERREEERRQDEEIAETQDQRVRDLRGTTDREIGDDDLSRMFARLAPAESPSASDED
jgi:hypothetical protein